MEFSGYGYPVVRSDYAPFGQQVDPGAESSNYKFTGLERDSETGQDHALFRQLSPMQGRWMSPDPYSGSYDFSNPQSFNRYSYVLNNPLGAIDPDGLDPILPKATDGTTVYANPGNWQAGFYYSPPGSNNGSAWFISNYGCPINMNLMYDYSTGKCVQLGNQGTPTASTPAPQPTPQPQPASDNSSQRSCYKPGLIGSLVSKGLGWLSNRGYGGIVGFGGGVAGANLTGDASRELVSDTSGHVGAVTTLAFGAGSVIGASASGGLTIGTSKYKSLDGYASWSTFASVSGGGGFGGSVSASTNASGTAYSLTVGAGYGLSAVGGVSYSWVTPICKSLQTSVGKGVAYLFERFNYCCWQQRFGCILNGQNHWPHGCTYFHFSHFNSYSTNSLMQG